MLKKTLIIFFLLSSNAFALASRNLNVFAEANMANALTKIARIYSQKNNVIVSLKFSFASELANEISGGAMADVFISSHDKVIEGLKNKGLIDVYHIGFFAEDSLVLLTSDDNHEIFNFTNNGSSFESFLSGLNQNKALILLDNERSSLGKFSNDIIKKLALNGLKISTSSLERGDTLLGLFKKDPNQYAILLSSQAVNLQGVKILATKKNANIFYQALVIAGDNMENSREFLKFLNSAAAKDILKQSGFKIN